MSFVILVQDASSVVLVLMAFVPVISVAVVLFMCRSMLMNSSWPVQQAYVMGVVEPGERATASSLTFAAWSVASALTPPIGGALLGAHLYALPFLLGGVCSAASMGVFYWFFHGVQPLAEREEGTRYGAIALGD